MLDVVVLDLAAQPNPPPALLRDGKWRCRLDRYGRVHERDVGLVDTIVLHQTACHYGPADPAKRHARALNVPIHALAFRDGTLALPYPVRWDLYHANGWNGRSLGLEIEGHFAGLEDDPTTVARREDLETFDTHAGTPDALDPLLVACARRGVLELVTRGRAAKMPIKYVGAHRQSAEDRRADPGQLLWKAVGIDYAVRELGLIALPSKTIGKGRPIPHAWDPSSSAPY